MADFSIKLQQVKGVMSKEEAIAGQLKQLAGRVEGIAGSGALSGSGYGDVRSSLRNLAGDIRAEKINITDMKAALEQITAKYEEAEKKITNDPAGRKGFENAIRELKNKLEEIGNNGGGTSQTCQDYDGDPVNMSNGNFVEEVQDLKIAGRIPLVFVRVYNAMSEKKTVLGQSWFCNYMDRVEKRDGKLYLLAGDGREEIFVLRDHFGEKQIYGSFFGSYEEITEDTEGFLWKRNTGEYRFSKTGRLSSYTGGCGGSLQFEYENGQLKKVIRGDGAYLEYVYDGEGYLKKITDHTGRSVSFYCEDGLLKEVTAPDRSSVKYTYDENGRLKSIINEEGVRVIENTYDEHGRVCRQVFADQEMMQYQYGDKEREVALIERNGRKTVYIHDEKGRHTRTVHESGEETYAYNDKNQRILHTDVLGNTFRRTFDARGNVTSVTDSDGNITHYTYDAMNRLVSYKNALGNQTVYHYDAKGNLLEVVAPDGTKTQYIYDEKDQPVKITNPDGSVVEVSYDKNGNIMKVQEAGKGTRSYQYDELNRVAVFTDGAGNRTQYEYDAKDRVTKVTNADGKSRLYVYGKSGNIESVTDFDGKKESFAYDVTGEPVCYTNKAGSKIRYEYDAMRNIAQISAPNGAVTRFAYDKINQITSVTGPVGTTIAFAYDANGNCISQTNEEGYKKHYTYDANRRLLSVTDEVGMTTTYTYDAMGRLVCKTMPDQSCETYRYDVMGRQTAKTDALGNTEYYTYTELGKRKSVTDAAGRKTEFSYYPGGLLKSVIKPGGEKEFYTYTANGLLASKTNAAGYEVRYRYDCLNRVTDITSNEGGHKSYTYDAVGNCTSMTDTKGNRTVYQYTVTGKLRAVIDAKGNATYYDYNLADQMIGRLQCTQEMDVDFAEAKMQNEANHSVHLTTYQRDLAGRVTAVTDSLGATEYYTYDKTGRVICKKDRDGFDTTYHYNADGTVSDIFYADGKQTHFTYDVRKKLNEIKDWLGTIKIQSDPAARVTSVTDQQGRQVSYAYGNAGERTQIVYPDGSMAGYEYDDALRLSAVTTAAGTTKFAYDEFGRLKEKIYPNQVRSVFEYDKADRLLALSHLGPEGLIDGYQYTYDAIGNKTAVEKKRMGLEAESGSFTYRYDELGQLLEVEQDHRKIRSYQYDSFGNRVASWDEDQGETRFVYNSANQLIKMSDEKNTFCYMYDRRGNLIRESRNDKTEKEYAFSAMNRLEHFSGEGKTVRNYTYNGLGQRVLETDGRQKISYILDLTKNYNNLLQREKKGATESYIWGSGLLGRETAEEKETYLCDELGSVTRCMDALGNVSSVYGYDEFGVDLSERKSVYEKQGKRQPFGYTGYRMDAGSGLYFAQAREYAPVYGRFISADPVGGVMELPLTANAYGYCWNNPAALVDLNGMFPSWGEVKDFCRKHILGVETVVSATTGEVDGGAGFYVGETVETSTQSDTYQGSILKRVDTVENGEVSSEYSINIPSFDFGNGIKIGVPVSVGVNTNGDGFGISASVGLDLGKFNLNVPAKIGLDLKDIVSLDLGADVGWGDDSVGLDLGAGLNPFSNLKVGVHQAKQNGDETITSKAGVYMRTGYVYAVVIAAAALYNCVLGMDPSAAWQMIQEYLNSLTASGACPIR